MFAAKFQYYLERRWLPESIFIVSPVMVSLFSKVMINSEISFADDSWIRAVDLITFSSQLFWLYSGGWIVGPGAIELTKIFDAYELFIITSEVLWF